MAEWWVYGRNRYSGRLFFHSKHRTREAATAEVRRMREASRERGGGKPDETWRAVKTNV